MQKKYQDVVTKVVCGVRGQYAECGDSSHRHYHGFYRDEADHTITQYWQSWPHDGLVPIINILHYPYI